MDPELKRMVEETHNLARENNKMLHALRRGQWFSFFLKLFVWIIVLALPLYLYQQYLQPIVDRFSSTPGEFTTGILGLPSSAQLEKLINSYKVGQ